MKHFLSILIFLLPLCSCVRNYKTAEILKDVESYISDAPDSALNVLNNIGKDRISNKRIHSKYLLLKTIALDKNFIDVTEDSLTRPAINWYERHGNDRERMLAYYYHGRVCQNAGDYNQAIIAFTNAEKYAKMCSDDFYLGMIYRGMHSIANKTYNHEEELKYAELSRDAFLKSGHNIHYAYALHSISYAKANLLDFNNSLQICDTVHRIGLANRDSTLLQANLGIAITNLVYKPKPDYDKAFSAFNFITDSLGKTPDCRIWNDIAYAYKMTKQYETANNIINSLLNIVDEKDLEGSLKFIQADIQYEQQNYKQACTNLKDVVIIQDSIYTSFLNRSAINVQKDYFKRQAEYDAERLKSNRIIIALIILSSLIATISLSYFWYRKVKDKEREKEMETARLSGRVREVLSELDKMKKANDEELSSMKNAIRSENKEMLSEFRDKINNMYRAKFMFLDNLCKQFYSYGMSAAKQKQIYKTVEENIKSFSDDEELYALEEIVNSFKDDVMKKLREDFPRFKDEDFKLMCYWYAGFSPAAMCVLMKIDEISDIYKRKSRLKSRIDKSDSPHKDCLLQNLHI